MTRESYWLTEVRVLATVWNKDGDHPRVGLFRYPPPSHSGETLCSECDHTYHDHGVIDYGHRVEKVCPGMVIIELPEGVERGHAPIEGEIHATPRAVFDKFYKAE